MYVPPDEFEKLKNDVGDVRTQVVKIETRLDGLPKRGSWLEFMGFATIFLAVAGGAIKLNTRITKIDGAIRVLAEQQSDQTQKLIRDLLAAANGTDSVPTAAKALDVATQLTATLRDQKRPASQEFFQSAIQNASQNKKPSLEGSLLKVQAQLAEYRSALQPPQPDKEAVLNCATEFKIKACSLAEDQITQFRI